MHRRWGLWDWAGLLISALNHSHFAYSRQTARMASIGSWMLCFPYEWKSMQASLLVILQSADSPSSERVVHHPNAPSPTRSVFNLGKSTLQILHWMNSPISNRPRGNCHSFHSVYRSQWLPNAHRLQSPRRYSQRRSCIQSGFPSISHKTSNGNNPVEHSRSYLVLWSNPCRSPLFPIDALHTNRTHSHGWKIHFRFEAHADSKRDESLTL